MAFHCLNMLLALLAVGLALPATSFADEVADIEQLKFFEKHIRPLLASKCVKCHGERKQEGGLRLDSHESLLAGGDSGPALVPQKVDESLLIEAVRYESFEMPPAGQLSEIEIESLVQWISTGAAWPKNIEPLRETSGVITDADRNWWAFQHLAKPEVPELATDVWCRTPIDRFVFRRLEQKEIQPAPQADKTTLVRRVFFDLVGMPPTPAEVKTYLDDDSENAWERLIDRLLADPRYGEHWARFWLDLVRYAESDGWNKDSYRPHIWRYRDFVVDSFNTDKPYPLFVRQQLAGDEIPDNDPAHLIATGYLRLGIYEYNQRDARSHWNDIMNEITDVTGDVFLGMGMACARCHDHKFDPLPQNDYFKLRAFFEPIAWRDETVATIPQQDAEYQKRLQEWNQQTAEIRAEIDTLVKPYHDKKWKYTVDRFPLDIQACYYKSSAGRNSWEHQMVYLVSRQFYEESRGPLSGITKEHQAQYDDLQKELAAFDQIKPLPMLEVMAATDFSGAISDTVIPDDPDKTPIEPGFLAVLSNLGEPLEQAGQVATPHSSGRRTALAKWIGRADNPLTMRVITNRIWQQHFGRGIVPSPNDFGHLGQPPTHPELLDWLTVTFVENEWSMKKLHKLILMSAVWQQSAYHPQAAENREKDVAEDLLWRASIRRLQAEQLRDAMLLASGELESKIGGPSVEAKSPRRALYVKSLRNTPDDFLHSFDGANGLKSISERNITTTPTQSLLMINGEYPLARARKLADRLLAIEFTSISSLLDYGCQLTWGRSPNADELATSLRFIEATAEDSPSGVAKEKITDFCHVLLNSSEFIYLD